MLAGICTHTHVHAHTDPTEEKGLRRKSRSTAPAQCSPPGSTMLLKMEMMSLCQGHMALSAAVPQGRELDTQPFLPSPPSLTAGDEGQSCGWRGEWTEERDPGVAEEWSKTSRGEEENIRWGLEQTIFQYASVQASCQATPPNSCSHTANKPVLFATGFWPHSPLVLAHIAVH